MSPWHAGINEGRIVIMIENYRSGLVWQGRAGAGISLPDCGRPDSPAAGWPTIFEYED